MTEDRPDTDPGQAGYLLGGRGLAALAEDLFGDVQDAVAVGPGIGALRPAAHWGAHRLPPALFDFRSGDSVLSGAVTPDSTRPRR